MERRNFQVSLVMAGAAGWPAVSVATAPADAATGLWNIDGIEPEDFESGQQGEEVDEEAEDIENSPVFDDVRSLIGMLALPASEGGVGGDSVSLCFAAQYPEVPSEEQLRRVRHRRG